MSSDVPTLVLMAGLPGAGKSTLALALGRALGWPVVDKDIFDAVARTAGVTPVSPTALAYDLAFALLKDMLVEQRLSVILDCPAVLPDPVERGAQLAQQAGRPVAVSPHRRPRPRPRLADEAAPRPPPLRWCAAGRARRRIDGVNSCRNRRRIW